MKAYRITTLILMVILLCCQSSIWAQPKVIRYDNSWAVLIGINRYKHWPNLEYAVQNVKAMKNLLMEEFGFEESRIIVLENQDATLEKIRVLMGEELPQKVGTNDQVLFFWSGHGDTFDYPTGDKVGYLIPVEGPSNPGQFYSGCLSMSEIGSFAKLIPARHILFLVDACYGGLAVENTYSSSNLGTDLHKISKEQSRQLITAGNADEKVVEKDEWQHSAFTYEMLSPLRKVRFTC